MRNQTGTQARSQAGFTLIELIATAVLLGFIGVFASIFISTGISGALHSRQAEENAQKGQIALDRIAIELRDINGGPGGHPVVTASPPSITYTSSLAALAGTRVLAYNANTKLLSLTPASGATAQPLADGVETCAMTFDATYGTITVTFTLANAGGNSFTITVKPRSAVMPASS